MKGPKLRLLHERGILQPELQGARRALDRFAAYGPEGDAAKPLRYDIQELDSRALRGVSLFWHHEWIIRAIGAAHIDPQTFLVPMDGTRPIDPARIGPGIIGVCLTEKELRLQIGGRGGSEYEPVGLGRYRTGALVSVYGLRERFYSTVPIDPRRREYGDPELVASIMDAMLTRQMGRVFIRSLGMRQDDKETENCRHWSCIMQKLTHITDLTEIARRGLEFCEDCARMIARETEMLARE